MSVLEKESCKKLHAGSCNYILQEAAVFLARSLQEAPVFLARNLQEAAVFLVRSLQEAAAFLARSLARNCNS